MSIVLAVAGLSSCNSEEQKETIIKSKGKPKAPEIVEGHWDDFDNNWYKGSLQLDTLMFFEALVGARASFGFIDKEGQRHFFGNNFSKIPFLDTVDLEENSALIYKTFLIGHRKIQHKEANSKDFVGESIIELITWAKPIEKELEFKSLSRKFKSVKAKFSEYSMGDLAHYIFIKKDGSEIDFGNVDDSYYDFEFDDFKDQAFLIFYYKTQYEDPFNGPYDALVIHRLIPIREI